MNLKSILILLSLFQGVLLFGQSGTTLRNQAISSAILSKNVKYNIYLPPFYDGTKEYPVLYYLHGFGGNNDTSRNLINVLDSLICSKQFPEIIIVLPDGGISWYMDDFKGETRYSSMFIEEFVPYIEQKYPVSKEACNTIVSGSSMGGFGALRFSMLYPEKFGICVSFQAGISTKEQILTDSEKDYNKFHHKLYGENLKPFERVNAHFISNNPLYIAEEKTAETLRKVNWYIQCCDYDYHSLPNAELHITFVKKEVNHEYRVTDGKHGRDCVSNSLIDALNFIKTILKN